MENKKAIIVGDPSVGKTIHEIIEQDSGITITNTNLFKNEPNFYHKIFKEHKDSYKYLETFDRPKSKFHK
jgi:hypothetical protein